MNQENVPPVPKLTLKKENLGEVEMKVVVMEVS
jgi:hypothetical protein